MSGNPRPVEATDEFPYGGWEPTDEELVGAVLAGNEQAFDDLATRHRHLAIRVAAGVVGWDRAEDVAQDALLLAFNALRSIQDRSKFSRWLCTIARFRALRVVRTESRRVSTHVALDESLLETLSDLACTPRQSEEGDEVLLAALERIPPDYAEVIRLHFLHDLPHQKIAEFVGVPVSTIKWRCFRGKELLREAIGESQAAATRCDRSAMCASMAPANGKRVPEGIDPCPGCMGHRASPLPVRQRDGRT